MIATTYLTSRQMILKTGWAEDPQQRMIQKLMLYGIPASLLISGGIFPIGVIIYWVTKNLFSLGQQLWVLHKYPPPPMAGQGARRARAGEPVRRRGRVAPTTVRRPRRRGTAGDAPRPAAKATARPTAEPQSPVDRRQGAGAQARRQAGQPEEGRPAKRQR